MFFTQCSGNLLFFFFLKATLNKLKAFLKFAPEDALEAASLQLSQFGV